MNIHRHLFFFVIRARRDQRGMIALIVVILIASATVMFGLSAALMSADELLSSGGWLHNASAISQSHSCVGEVLSRLTNNVNLNNGNVNLSIGNINCKSSLTGSGNLRLITTRATSTDGLEREYVHRAYVNVNVNTTPFTIVDYKDILNE